MNTSVATAVLWGPSLLRASSNVFLLLLMPSPQQDGGTFLVFLYGGSISLVIPTNRSDLGEPSALNVARF